jgi:hypothetical protein
LADTRSFVSSEQPLRKISSPQFTLGNRQLEGHSGAVGSFAILKGRVATPPKYLFKQAYEPAARWDGLGLGCETEPSSLEVALFGFPGCSSSTRFLRQTHASNHAPKRSRGIKRTKKAGDKADYPPETPGKCAFQEWEQD